MLPPAAFDVHAHLLPPTVVAALEWRAVPPRITGTGAARRLEIAGERLRVDAALIDAAAHVAAMEADGIAARLVSLPGLFGIDTLPVPEARDLTAAFNDGVAAMAGADPFLLPVAALPLRDPALAADRLRAALADGHVGAILPASAFADEDGVRRLAPVLEVVDRARAMALVHAGPSPFDDAVVPPAPRDDAPPALAIHRHVGVAVQAQLSRAVLTLAYSPTLADLPGVAIHVINLGGDLPFLLERMEATERHRTGGSDLRARLRRFTVDTASFGPRAIDLAVEAFGADGVTMGTDAPVMPTGPTLAAVRARPDAPAILRANAAARLGDPVAARLAALGLA